MRAALMALSLLMVVGVCHAEKIFRWTGSDGKVYYGDTPPAGARNVQPFGRTLGPSKDGSDEEGGAASSARESTREADCNRKRAQLATYRKAARLVERDSLGAEREFTPAERNLLIARTEADLEAQCGDAPASENAGRDGAE